MHIMLDLETMGNSSNAPIIAIGAVAFDESGVRSEFYAQVSLESSMRAGMKPDASTIMWWMKQSDEARGAFSDTGNAVELYSALQKFTVWLRQVGVVDTVWGNGAAFDNVILGNAYDAIKLFRSWEFWQDRCYRTVRALHPHVKMVRSGTHHNALDDARNQAEHLIDIATTCGIELG